MITLVEQDELKGATSARARNYASGRFAIRGRLRSIHRGQVIGGKSNLIDVTTAQRRASAAGERLMEPKARRIV